MEAPEDDARLLRSIRDHEGRVLDACGMHRAYRDHFGNLTIGFGTLLDERLTISEEVAETLLRDELAEKIERLSMVRGFDLLVGVRRAVVVEMSYQMGVGGSLRFKLMWGCIRKEDWRGAAREIRDSTFWRDPKTHARAERLAIRMETGVWEDLA